LKGALLPVSLLCAVVATVGLAFIALRRPPAKPDPAGTATTRGSTVGEEASHERVLRPYQTTATLAEDLRDALASGDGAQVQQECWRVSRALRGKARWTLENLAPHEASPRVRALLVLATGVHVPDDRVLHDFLRDRAPLVRRAAALAIGYAPKGSSSLALAGSVQVPVGRELPTRSRATLDRYHEKETDRAAREAMTAVLK